MIIFTYICKCIYLFEFIHGVNIYVHIYIFIIYGCVFIFRQMYNYIQYIYINMCRTDSVYLYIYTYTYTYMYTYIYIYGFLNLQTCTHNALHWMQCRHPKTIAKLVALFQAAHYAGDFFWLVVDITTQSIGLRINIVSRTSLVQTYRIIHIWNTTSARRHYE